MNCLRHASEISYGKISVKIRQQNQSNFRPKLSIHKMRGYGKRTRKSRGACRRDCIETDDRWFDYKHMNDVMVNIPSISTATTATFTALATIAVTTAAALPGFGNKFA